MLKMIIADDERAIRDSIHSAVDWRSRGIDVVGLARNGSEAYEMIVDEGPDIVLTDICMPGFSGLQLIAKLAETSPDTRFIVLSGFSDFEYAREAMRYGVRHYLLKPCSHAQVVEAVEAVRTSCIQAQQVAEERRQLALLQRSLLRQEDADEQKRPVDEMILYVRNHISNPSLSLKWLAENVLFMNADYLGKQFTKTTGEKFSAFLNRTRIECAMEILASQREGYIYNIAELVGLGNSPQYFSHLFKKATGKTPTEYMEQLSGS